MQNKKGPEVHPGHLDFAVNVSLAGYSFGLATMLIKRVGQFLRDLHRAPTLNLMSLHHVDQLPVLQYCD